MDRRRHRAELELIYHWCTNTYATVSFDGQQRIGTQHEITQFALKHDFLLDAVFALTSLHLASLRPKESQVLVDDALRYQTSAISSSRRSLENLSASECRAQFQCSALLGICALALHNTDGASTVRRGPTDALISLAQLWRGTGSIMAVSHKLLGSGAYEQIFPPLPLAEVVETAEPDLEVEACIARLEDLAKTHETSSAIFLEAVAGLRDAFQSSSVNDGTYVYQVLKWAPTVPLEFIDQLSQREPLACIATMVYAVSFQLVEDQWWMRGFSRCLVEELAVIVANAKPEWMDVIEWAKKKTAVRRSETVSAPPE